MLPNPSIYKQLGFKTIPVTYGRKAAPPLDWTHTDSDTLWSHAPKKSNTALQAGVSGMFLLDPDTEKGDQYVKNYMSSIGVDAWKVITWRGYTHHWVRTDMPVGTQWNGKLVENSGDWRGKNGYGLAAPSVIDTGTQYGTYVLPNNNPYTVPFVSWSDLLPLLRLSRHEKFDPSKTKLPVPMLKRTLPRWAYYAAEQIASMDDTGPVLVGSHSWSSRSEAVMSIMMSALLNGHSPRLVQKMCGEYKTNHWWNTTTAKAVHFLSSESDRPYLTEMYNSSYDLSIRDQDVFKAMLTILWYVGSIEGGVSNRDIQLLVARGNKSVSSSVRNLTHEGYITLKEKSDGKKASTYTINKDVVRTTSTTNLPPGIHPEVYRWGALSGRTRNVLSALVSDKTPKELAQELEMSLSGVYYSLNKLKKYNLVTKIGKYWSRTKLTSDKLNTIFNAQDTHQIRKTRINEERRRYQSNRGET